jgi:hypothetical protein
MRGIQTNASNKASNIRKNRDQTCSNKINLRQFICANDAHLNFGEILNYNQQFSSSNLLQ